MRSQNADLVLMEGEPSEDQIYDALSSRLKDGKIYTAIGDVLISVNPYTTVAKMYGQDVIAKYTGSNAFQNEPHIYALAEQMYKNLRDGNQDQCVLISGESGAGKTEASKKVMEYIAAVSRAGGAVGRVAGMLLGSNPILEAFGNAKTIRNDNSSRFGKYMEIVFDYRAVPFGGRITNYLLEKVRVVNRSKGERSFHIFYMMLAGLSDGTLSQLGLSRKADTYAYLGHSECCNVDGFNDKQEMDRVVNAMKVLGFTPDIQASIWKALAGILLLGNVDFETGASADTSAPSDLEPIGKIAKLWCVEPSALASALVSRTFATAGGNKSTLRKDGVNSPLDVDSAYDARDALAKAMYSGVFDFAVMQLNKAMAPPEGLKNRLTVGILDIYGFEIFENNSFEQFCINWCNEKLQQYFIELTLKEEQEDYAREGIEWIDVEYFNNKVICDLIEQSTAKAGVANGPKPGLLALLNEACVLKNFDEEAFLLKLSQVHSDHEFFDVPNFDKGKATAFEIRHYAGPVGYEIRGFLSKNVDQVFSDQRKLIEGSKDELICGLMQNTSTDDVKRPESAGTKFKNSLADLIATLSKCRPSYVRCIKPNESKSALTSEPERFRHQISYLGLLENLKIRRAGYCNRQTYEEFLLRYKMTVPRGKGSCWPVWKGSAKEGCLVIIKHFEWATDMFALGKTKVFIRKPRELFALETARHEALPMVATMIQSGYRGHLARVYWNHAKAAVFLQKKFRGYKCAISYGQKLAATKVIGMIKAQWERLRFEKIKATSAIQSAIRQKWAAQRHLDLIKICLLQASMYARLERRKFTNATATFKIQSLAKAKFERQKLQENLGGALIKKNMQLLVRRVWLKGLIGLYKDAKKGNQWGRGFHRKWTSFQHPVAVDVTLFDRMEETWRYRNLLASIKGREEVYRHKVLAYDTFRDQKPWEPGALWGDHNYLASELNPTADQFKLAFDLMPENDAKVYFSDLVDKMNPNGKMVERGILLTNKGFYRMTPGKYKPDKHNALSDIKKITLTQQGDNLVILHHETSRDSIINFGAVIGGLKKPQLRRTRSYSDIGGKNSLLMEDHRAEASRSRSGSITASSNAQVAAVVRNGDDDCERYSEFVVAVLLAIQDANLPTPEVSFENELSVNVSKKPGQPQPYPIKSLHSSEMPNSFWQQGKGESFIYSSSAL